MVVTFKEENLMTFKHLFLKGYVDGGMAAYALYRQDDVYDHIDYVLQQVTGAGAAGLQCFNSPSVWLCCVVTH